MQNSHTRFRRADEIRQNGSSRDFFLQRNKEAGVHDVAAIAFGKRDVISLLEKAHACLAGITEFSQRRQPARADDSRAAGGMGELVRGVIGRFDNDHHRGFALLETPPRHRPRLDDVALQEAVVGGNDFSIFDGTNRVILLRPIARQQISLAVAEDGVIGVARVGRPRPIELAHCGGVFLGSGIKDQIVIRPFQADRQVER